MKKIITAVSLFTLAAPFSLAADVRSDWQEQIARAIAEQFVSANAPQAQISDAVVLRIMKNIYQVNFKFTDRNTVLEPDDWAYPSFKFQRTSNGFFARGKGLKDYEKVQCTSRLDGFYTIDNRRTGRRTADKNGNFVSGQQVLTNYQNRNLKNLNKLETFNQMNKDMISSMLAAYGIYTIDYVKDGQVHVIYGDALDKNVEIKFIKKDDKTLYGTLFVSKDNTDDEGSEIYAFKYTDQTTPNKQRVKLMTKRVVQEDLDEQNPNTKKYGTVTRGKETTRSQKKIYPGLLSINVRSTTSTISQYEEFLAEGVIHTTFTKSNGVLYKNQQALF